MKESRGKSESYYILLYSLRPVKNLAAHSWGLLSRTKKRVQHDVHALGSLSFQEGPHLFFEAGPVAAAGDVLHPKAPEVLVLLLPPTLQAPGLLR